MTVGIYGVVQCSVAERTRETSVCELIAGFLSGTSPADPVTFALVALVLSAVALSACLVPARRAASLSPATALRHD